MCARAGLLCVVVLGGILCCAGAALAPPAEPGRQVGGAHVLVHYDAATTDAAAKAVLDAGEQAWTTQIGTWGFRAPESDAGLGGDNRLDIYLMRPEQGTGDGGFAGTDDETDGNSGYIEIEPKSARPAFVQHEFAHVLQYGYLIGDRPFLYEASAEWAAASVGPASDLTKPLFLTHPQASLDCDPEASCLNDVGYGQWPFFEYVSEHVGPLVMRDVWQQYAQLDGDGSQALPAIANGLAAHGTSLADTWNGYVKQNLTPGAYSNPILNALKARTPTAQALPLRAGKAKASAAFSIDHLAAAYFSFKSACGKAKARRLTISVALPAGSKSVPALRLDTLGKATAVTSLAASGATASATVSLRACTTGLLAVPNPSATADGAAFLVAVSAG